MDFRDERMGTGQSVVVSLLSPLLAGAGVPGCCCDTGTPVLGDTCPGHAGCSVVTLFILC